MMSHNEGYLLIDTESGGRNEQTDALLEVGARMLTDTLEPVPGPDAIFHALIQPAPKTLLTPRAIKLNGHTWALNPQCSQYQQADTEVEFWPRFLDWLQERYGHNVAQRITMVGWNVSFDYGFLRASFNRSACSEMYDEDELLVPHHMEWPFHHHKVELNSVVRYLHARQNKVSASYSLTKIAAEYNTSFAAHTALGDATACLQVTHAAEKAYQTKCQNTHEPQT